MAANAVDQAQEKRKLLEAAINADDKDEFLKHVDNQISFSLECTLGLIALLIVVELLLAPWSNLATGLMACSSVSFVLVLIRQVGWVRDNPLEGPDQLEYRSEKQKEEFVTAALYQQKDLKKPSGKVRKKKS